MRKGKITATIGISASGKSTWAHEQWKKEPYNTVIVERDSIRNLLFGYNDSTISEYYERKDLHKLEEKVSKVQEEFIRMHLADDFHVIISDTNLNRKRDLESLNKYGVEVNFKVFNIDLEEAIKRDSQRARTVGGDVIEKQYRKFTNLIKDLNKNPVQYYMF